MTKEQAKLLVGVLTRFVHFQHIATEMLAGLAEELAVYGGGEQKRRNTTKVRRVRTRKGERV